MNSLPVSVSDQSSNMRCSLPNSGCTLALLLAAGLRVEATVFELFQLPEAVHPHPQPYCNDGSQAGYYHDTDYSKLARVHVHLQVGWDWLTRWSRDSMLTSDWATPTLRAATSATATRAASTGVTRMGMASWTGDCARNRPYYKLFSF